MSTPAHYSLSQLQQHLGRVIALNMRQPVWIRAELSGVDIRQHGYFTLVEQDDYNVRARADAVIWGKDMRRLRKKLGDSWGLILQKGRQVLLQVQPELHEYYGLKLTICDIFEEYTIGQLELQRQQTAEKLRQMGLWGLNSQRVLPEIVQRVAVISSPEAAGLQDFLNHLQQNEYGYRYQCQLFPAAVQGANALREIPLQLQTIARQATDFDCVVLVRGGGSKLDLVEFDHWEISSAVAQCPLPVLTGIGHDIDTSLADQVAHTSLKTPTAVANFLIDRTLFFESAAVQTYRQIEQYIRRKAQQQTLQLQQLEHRFRLVLQQRLQAQFQTLDRLEGRLRALDPHQPLQRGYALVFDDQGRWIRTAEELQGVKSFTIRFADGVYRVG